MSSILTIDGTSYDQSGRRAANYLIDGWGWDLESGYWCEFHEHTSGPQPVISGPRAVSLSVSGTTAFAGDIVSVSPAIDGAGRRTWGYRCLGLEYRASWIPVTANDGTGMIRFNVDPSNADAYVASMAGQSVGQILSYCLSLHSSALSAAGITTDATTSSGLAALTLVPNEEVQVCGERLWPALQGVLRRWARNIRLVITGAGLVRVVDVTAGTAHTLTLGTDPIDPPLFSRNWTTSATRFVVRGGGVIEPGYVSYLKGTLTKAWTTTEENSWTYANFTNPSGAMTDHGAVTSVTSATTVTIQSSDASRTWGVNYWNGIQGWVYLTKSTGLGLQYQEARPITATSALTAGGTATITLGYALQNSASNAYDSYQIIAANPTLSNGGLYDVWRLWNVNDPGGLISGHLVPTFPVQVPFLGYDGLAATLTSAPMCQVVGPTNSASMPFVVMPNTGQILFTRPVLEAINSTGNLASGSYTKPTDVYVLLAYSRGALTTTYPPDSGGSPQYSGTAYSAAGLQRTAYQDAWSWRYGGNSSVVNGLAQMLQVSLKNTLTEGTVEYRGLYTATQDPTGGHLLNIAGNGYTTGDESLNIPVRAYSVRYLTEGGGLNYRTTLRCSNRQDPRTGEGFYQHLSVLGGGAQWGAAGVVTGGGMNFVGQAGWDWQFGESGPWDMGDMPRAGRRRPRTRLRSSEDRFRAARAHDLEDREARSANRVRAAEGSMSADERDNLEHLVDSDNRRRARALESPDEAARRHAAEGTTMGPPPGAPTEDERQNRRRLIALDNRRRARTLEGTAARRRREAGERYVSTDPGPDQYDRGEADRGPERTAAVDPSLTGEGTS
jgi:hypothetical protein